MFFWHGKTSEEFTPSHAHDHALVLDVAPPETVSRWKQIRYAGLVFNRKEQRILLSAVGIFVIAAIASVWAIANDRIIRVPATGGKIVEAVIGSPKNINPLYAAANDPDADLSAMIYSGLFRRTKEAGIEPDLAEQFSWSEDGKRLSLTLREGIFFHDGTPLTTDDVIFTLRAAKDPSWHSTYANTLRDATFQKDGDRSIVIELKEPDMYILDALTIGILPAHIWQEISAANALLADANIRPIGSGPFRVRSFRRNASGSIFAYTLDRYDRYHGVKPYLDQFEFRFYPDRSAAEEAVRGGQADMIAFVSSQSIKKLTKGEQLAYTTLELPQLTLAFLNVNQAILKDAKVRQALTLAVDRKDVIDAQAGISNPISGPYPFETPDEETENAEARLEKARTLLDQAGWKLEDGAEVRTKKTSTSTNEELSLAITVPDIPDLVAVADVLARQWSLLGAKVGLDVQSPEYLIGDIEHMHQTQILVWNVLLNSVQDIYPIWWSAEASGNGLNLSNLSDRDVDNAIKVIRSATTTQGLADARKNASNAIRSRFPAAFLTRPAYGYVHSKKIKGMSERMQISAPSDRLTDVSNWYIHTAWRWK